MLDDAGLGVLRGVVGEASVSVRQADLEAHSVDESWLDPHVPDVVVWPSSTEQVAAIVRYAYEHDVPVVPWVAVPAWRGILFRPTAASCWPCIA